MSNSQITKLILLRHGEVDNPNKLLYGRLPGFGLSKEGMKNVLKAYENLKNESVEVIYTSPLLRTQQTAGVFGKKLGLSVHTDKRLTEVRLYCQGVSLHKFKAVLQRNLYSEKNYKKGQESIEEIGTRMKSFVTFIQNKYTGRTVLAVSHGDPIVIIQSEILHTPFTWEFKRDNYVKPANYRIITLGSNSSEWNIV